MNALWMAQQINRMHGGTVIAAWQLDELDETWLELFAGVGTLPRRQARQTAILDAHAKFRREYYQKWQ